MTHKTPVPTLTSLLAEAPLPSHYDNLSLQAFRDCPRYFALRHVLHLSKGGSPMSLPAAFGIALHAGIEYLWRGRTLSEAVEYAYSEFNSTKCEWAMKEPYTPERVAIALQLWKEKYLESNASFDFEAPEVGFVFPLTPESNYYGRIDGVYSRGGKSGIYELKTTKSAYYIRGNPHNQITGYMVALSQYREEPLHECTLDIIQLQVRSTQFFRYTEYRSEERLQEWWKETTLLVETIRQYAALGTWPKNTGHCSAWGGCPFTDLCELQHESQVPKLLALYEVRPWAPWEVENEGGGRK